MVNEEVENKKELGVDSVGSGRLEGFSLCLVRGVMLTKSSGRSFCLSIMMLRKNESLIDLDFAVAQLF